MNDSDDSKPPPFHYIAQSVPRSREVAQRLARSPLTQCDCASGDCRNAERCACAWDQASQAHTPDGKLIFTNLFIIRECSELCKCHHGRCPNRVVGRGVQVGLEVFKTDKCGWGVRATERIPAFTFVAEYCGEILTHDEAEQRRGEGKDAYLLEAHTLKELRKRFEGVPKGQMPPRNQRINQKPHVIDARVWGNVARFFNGSCDPNMSKERVTNRQGEDYPCRLAFYTKEDVAPGQELTWDYEYHDTTEKGSLGYGIECHCGKPNCRGRLY